jgi:hypothetical protein
LLLALETPLATMIVASLLGVMDDAKEKPSTGGSKPGWRKSKMRKRIEG